MAWERTLFTSCGTPQTRFRICVPPGPVVDPSASPLVPSGVVWWRYEIAEKHSLRVGEFGGAGWGNGTKDSAVGSKPMFGTGTMLWGGFVEGLETFLPRETAFLLALL